MATWAPVPAGSPFGPAALPLGVFAPPGGPPRTGVRIGDHVLDLAALARTGVLRPFSGALDAFSAPTLDALLAAGPGAWRATREHVAAALDGTTVPAGADGALHPLAEVRLELPFTVADFADFYSSLQHATNFGRMLRPGAEPLPPNWRHVPIAYHGRAGTVVVSGTDVVRPRGQTRPDPSKPPVFGPTRKLDVELELGYVIGTPSAIGASVPVAEALEHVFGVVLLCDWSARDVQAWEAQPLGPFLSKSFATSISAWVLPLEAVHGARVQAPAQVPEPLPYLREPPWALDIDLELELCGEVVARASARHLYWSPAQQIAHLTSNGAALRTGDLIGTGTVSGPGPRERGSLAELSWNGETPLELAGGATRTFLEDGDTVVLRGIAPGPIGLGEVVGRVLPAA